MNQEPNRWVVMRKMQRSFLNQCPHSGRSGSGSSAPVCSCGIVVEIWEFTGSRWMAAVLVALTAWRQRGASRTPLNLQCEHN